MYVCIYIEYLYLSLYVEKCFFIHFVKGSKDLRHRSPSPCWETKLRMDVVSNRFLSGAGEKTGATPVQ